MKRLTLLRHGKSSWDDPALRDFDRPLNDRGRTASMLMGREAARRQLTFDSVIVSPAQRTRETIALFENGYGEALNVNLDENVYAASARTLLSIVQQVDPLASSLLVVGHNPGLQNLAAELAESGAGAVEQHYPTATLCLLNLPVARWEDVRPGAATFELLLKPKEVEGA